MSIVFRNVTLKDENFHSEMSPFTRYPLTSKGDFSFAF